MGKKQVIARLVDRKLAAPGKGKAFCVCLARRICFAAVQQAGQAARK